MTARVRVHLRGHATGPIAVAACGWLGVEVSTDPARVTCRLCLRRARTVVAERLGISAPATYGARSLDDRGVRALARSSSPGVETPRQWRSGRQAIAALVAHLADGAPLASSSRPARFAPVTGSRSDAMTRSDRVHGVACSVAAAFAGPVGWDGVEVSADQQTAILAWAHGGLGGLVEGSRVRPERMVAEARERWGLDLTEHQVSLIVRAGVRAVSAELRRRGEMDDGGPTAEEEGETMRPLPTYDLRGWDEIADALGVSRGVARRMIGLDRPPPVYRVDGVIGVHARRAELEAWVLESSRSVRSEAQS